jgi:hypothetical protein
MSRHLRRSSRSILQANVHIELVEVIERRTGIRVEERDEAEVEDLKLGLFNAKWRSSQ